MAKVGCCGFPVSRARYFGAFGLVEVQRTFYQPPGKELAEKWRRQSPGDFEYTLKAWQLITHGPESPTYRKLKTEIPLSRRDRYGFFKPTGEVLSAWDKTREIAEILGARVIVFQCPASFRPTEENRRNLGKFFSSLGRNKFILAWEPRGEWGDGEIKAVCRDLDLVHCVDPLKETPVHGRIRYFRLHGIGGYKYRYTPGDLNRLTELAEESGKQSYFMFNNVFMFDDALAFRGLLKA